RRFGVFHQLLELGGEPGAGEGGVRQGAGHAVAVALVARVRRVAHAIEALALVVLDGGARAVGVARGLRPHVGVDAVGGRRARSLAETRARLIAPVARVDPAVDT